MTLPKPFDRILVGVDGQSNHAVLRAASLAHRLGSQLEMVHAVEVPHFMWPGLDPDELSAIHAKALVHARTELLKTLDPILHAAEGEWNLDEQLTVFPGPAAKVLLRRAVEFGADLIILGPHAKQSLFDFGSTARAVLSQTGCPIWTQTNAVEPIKQILVPVDFSQNSLRALESAKQLASRFEASLRVLHCYSPPVFAFAGTAELAPEPVYVIENERQAAKDELEKLMNSFEWDGIEADSTFAEGEAATQTIEKSSGADLIVIGTHGRTGLSRFLVGSVAYSVLKQAEIPVLAIPDPDRYWQLGEGDAKARTSEPPVQVY